MDKLYIFYNVDKTLNKIIEESEGKLTIKNDSFETILKYKDSEIVLVNEDGTSSFNDDSKLWGFFTNSQDLEILKYLFIKHKILFYEIDALNNISYLNPVKHKKYITHIINSFVYETMLMKGIINDILDIEKHIGLNGPFFNDYIIEKGQIIRYRIVKREYIKYRIKNFLKKIYVKLFCFKK